MGIVKQKLNQLTSLRFFAAVLIVIHHSIDLFGYKRPPFAFDHGVSLFFVLSGFILFYVYPELKNWTEIRGFWRARFAHIWPSHLACFLLLVLLFKLPVTGKTAFANLALIQAWIPIPMYYFSYNAPSWCISVEWFFYMVFPLLILKTNHANDSLAWFLRLFLSLLIVISLITFTTFTSLPNFEASAVSTHGILYISPLSRILEFTLGIFVAHVYGKQKEKIQWNHFRATTYEILAMLLAIASMNYAHLYPVRWAYIYAGPSAGEWLAHTGTFPIFALIVFVFAIGRGKLSAILSHRLPVLLGEISFSMFLLHQVLLRYYDYQINIVNFPHLPRLLTIGVYWGILILLSYLMWMVIETPCRRWIAGRKRTPGIQSTGVSGSHST